MSSVDEKSVEKLPPIPEYIVVAQTVEDAEDLEREVKLLNEGTIRIIQDELAEPVLFFRSEEEPQTTVDKLNSEETPSRILLSPTAKMAEVYATSRAWGEQAWVALVIPEMTGGVAEYRKVYPVFMG